MLITSVITSVVFELSSFSAEVGSHLGVMSPGSLTLLTVLQSCLELQELGSSLLLAGLQLLQTESQAAGLGPRLLLQKVNSLLTC